ncbi:MAG: hypothetical protein NDI69_08500 [Bacteriovoracaceae bacterium]|nr:hypothetical protein [Bacteriovoracaceae bacterium]
MKLFIIITLIFSCTPVKTPDMNVGDCVVGQNMEVWQLLREDEGKFLFAQFPVREGKPVHLIDDIAVFKKIECPID